MRGPSEIELASGEIPFIILACDLIATGARRKVVGQFEIRDGVYVSDGRSGPN